MTGKKDKIFNTLREGTGNFRFDAEVAAVFADMISRSVPGYQQILEMLPTLVRCYVPAGGRCYDLGCSLGAGMLAMAEGLPDNNGTIIGIDNSPEMISEAQTPVERYAATHQCNLSLECADVMDYPIVSADLVLMNFTLQFINPDKRDDLIKKIFDHTRPGGVLVLSEKIRFTDPDTDRALVDIHHQYKADQGYSALEISQKRDAIENVLIPETLETHTARLRQAGYRVVTPWVQNLQFVSLLAIK